MNVHFLGALKRSGIPSRYWGECVSESDDWTTKVDGLQSKLSGGGMLYALVGSRGTGKTQAAAQVGKHACMTWANGERRKSKITFSDGYSIDHYEAETDTPVVYRSATEIFSTLRAAFRDNGMTEGEAIRPFLRASLLIIDEAQERAETEFEDRQLGYIVDKRYGNMQNTLLVSNLTAADFAKKMGPSILDRLAQCGGIVEFTGKSFRRSV